MKKILLLSPPYLPEYMRNARCDFVSLSGTQWFPIWLGYCGCLLEKNGYSVKLIDAPAYGLSHRETEDEFMKFKPDFLIMYSGDKSVNNDIEFADNLLEKYNCKAAFVGPYYSITPYDILKKSRYVFYGIEGEFEYPVLELLEGHDPKGIKNLLWKDGDRIAQNEKREYLSNNQLDDMPFVSEFFHRHLDFKYYRAPSEYHPFVDIMTGRGCCWGLCSYCLWVHSFIKGSRYSTRSMENVLDEFALIEKTMPYIRSVMIQDDTFPANRVAEFSEYKLKRGLKIPWSCYVRADIDYDTLRLMKKAGCRNLHVGYESADNNILKRIGKGLRKQKMSEFTVNAKKACLRIHGDFAIGFPGDTEKTIEETIAWACQIRPHTAQFQLMIPFRRTPFYRELELKGWLKNGAPDYPDLSSKKMEALAKKAYRKFYISLPYLLQALRYPKEHIFGHLVTIRRSLPSMLWRKWNVR